MLTGRMEKPKSCSGSVAGLCILYASCVKTPWQYCRRRPPRIVGQRLRRRANCMHGKGGVGVAGATAAAAGCC